MKELGDIVDAFQHLPAGTESALATVVRVTGSAYRSPGARLLIAGDGKMIGQVSGGCLERDVVQRAGGVIASSKPVLVRYETSNDPESGTGYSLGCGGAIDILIEPLNRPAGQELMRWLVTCQSERCVIATAISRRHRQIPLGQRMMVDSSRRCFGSIGDALLSEIIADKAGDLLGRDGSATVEVATTEGAVEIFFELLKPPMQLLIFGAGNDAVPLAAVGRLLGWSVTVVDLGSSPPDPSRSWAAARLIRCQIEQVEHRIQIGAETAAVVMTHNFGHDQKLLRWLASQPVSYLGMLGPRHRTDQLLGDLQPGKLRAPVGLDIGAETPQEVALSIAAEITAVLRGRSCVPLSSRDGPIHIRAANDDYARNGGSPEMTANTQGDAVTLA